MQVRIFVYGTLKQGQRNFERYCRGVLAIERAYVIGRLFYLSDGRHLSYGYPMLEVPQEHVLAIGTRDYLQDAGLPMRLTPEMLPGITGDWEQISGEIHTFDDPVERFAAMDVLEDFRPGERSLYHRVLLRVQAPQNTNVWTYVAADGHVPAGAAGIGACWPSL